MRFDIPSRDNDARWRKCADGSYYIDGGDPILAEVKEITAHVCDNTQERITFLHVDLEIDEGAPFQKVEELIEFQQYLSKLKHAAKIEVDTSDSGFTQEQSHFLQHKGCASVTDVANRYIGSFHRRETRMAKSIEKVLKEKWGLTFCADPGWLTWRGPAEETPKSRKTRKKVTTL